MLLDCALSEEGEGPPAKLVCLSGAQAIDFDSTTVTFTNSTSAKFDMVLGADGVVVSLPHRLIDVYMARLTSSKVFSGKDHEA